ncbi:hypothetical protein K438DRAFT_1989617 [Mycena galopus ATCC 62051]|nr:hypothetical protein K438DRAFT_1989617 [Mycena galopus ATCC 62051]
MKLRRVALCIWAPHVIGHVVRAATGNSSSNLTSTVTPVINFNKIANMTARKSAVITWVYSAVSISGPQALTLSITNATLTQSITTAPIDPTVLNYRWPTVNVTDGWYTVIATLPLAGFRGESLPFYVQTGTGTSASEVNIGAIAGGVVGGLFIVLGALTLMLRRRRQVVPARTGAPSALTRQSTDGHVPLPSATGENIILALDSPAPAVVESQEAMFLKLALIQGEIRPSEGQPNEGHEENPNGPARAEEDLHLLPVSSGTPHDGHALKSHVFLPQPTGENTVLALDIPVAPAVVESQEAMFLKLARIQEEMRSRERRASEGYQEGPNGPACAEEVDTHLLPVSSGTPHDDHALESTDPGRTEAGLDCAEAELNDLDLEQLSTPELVRQLRGMAQRLAVMEARIDRIPDEPPPDYTARSSP